VLFSGAVRCIEEDMFGGVFAEVPSVELAKTTQEWRMARFA
jgi:hypothetical protein